MRRRPDDREPGRGGQQDRDRPGDPTAVLPAGDWDEPDGQGEPDGPGAPGQDGRAGGRDRRVYSAGAWAGPAPDRLESGVGRGPRTIRPPRRASGRRVGRAALVLLVVLAVALGALYGVLDSRLRRVAALGDEAGRPAGGRGTNWLIVGSDSREGLSPAARERLGTGFAAGRRTDTIMIMHLPGAGGSPTLVSLPRDSYVPIPGHGRNKLNAAFAFGGPRLLAQTVEQATGLRMDHYMEIGFSGFAGLVDAVGGVTMCIDRPVRDRWSGLDIRKAGCQQLDSKQALAYVRSRHAFAGGDLDRARHQREFIGALVKKATSPAVLLNPFKVISLAGAGAAALTVNQGDHLYHLARLTFAMRALNGKDGSTVTVPVRGTGSVAGAGSVVFWDRDRALALFQALNTDKPVKGLAGQ